MNLQTYDSETAKSRYEILPATNKSFELDSKISIGTKDNFEDLVALGRHLAMFYLPGIFSNKKYALLKFRLQQLSTNQNHLQRRGPCSFARRTYCCRL